jgi:hypothetical protein
MGPLVRLAPVALLVSFAACNALTGADGLIIDQDDEKPLREGRGRSGDDAGTNNGGTTRPSGSHHVDGGTDDDVEIPSSQTDAGFDASAPPAGLNDTFNRTNAPTVGNGWLAKSNQFEIANGAVVQNGNTSFVNAILSRPELVRDVQVSVDVTYNGNFDSDPTLHARMQSSSDAIDQLDGYTFYVYRDMAGVDREDPGDNGERLARTDISPNLQTGVTYRMIFRVAGTAPVVLEATLVKPDGTRVFTLSANDSSPRRITSTGRVGFGAGAGNGTRWDNFERSDL